LDGAGTGTGTGTGKKRNILTQINADYAEIKVRMGEVDNWLLVTCCLILVKRYGGKNSCSSLVARDSLKK
jgi:hypothetical protein